MACIKEVRAKFTMVAKQNQRNNVHML